MAWLWLVELHLVGGSAYYLSSGEACSFGGQLYQANRVKSVSGIVGQYIDGLSREFGNGSVVLNGLSNDGSTNLPFVSAEGITNLDGGKMLIHGFEAISGTGVASLWHGYIKNRTYDGSDHTATIEASFLWDAPTATVPSSTLQQEGFGVLDTNTVKESVIDDTTIPIVIGAGQFKVRPNIYYTLTIGNVFRVNAVISGTRAGLPFNLNDILNVKLFDITRALSVNFHNGPDADVAPHNATVFPDLLAHNNVAYFSADFPIDASNKDKLDNIAVDDVKILLANGRPIKATGLPTQNAALMLQDVLTDDRFGFGVDVSDFSDITATANASGTLWQCRLELHDPTSIADWVQNACLQTAMFITFNNGKIQVGQKSGSETSVATFATTRSGHSGGRIVDDKVIVTFESSDSLDNQANIKYRALNRHEHEVIAYDETAQTHVQATGGKVRKTNKQDYTFDLHTDKTQVGIAASMLIREQQNANMVIEFSSPIAEGIYPLPGELITVWSEDIPNNAGNNQFRVIAQPFDTGGAIPRIGFKAKVYKSDVYQYSTAGISIDEIRSGSDVSSLGRPPDVVPVSITVIDKTTNDTGGVFENLRATWSYPVVDLTGDAAGGVTHEYPIHSVALYWRYTDEDVNAWKLGAEVLYPVATGDIAVDFHKNKIVEVMFVALSLARSHGTFGYVEDPTKTAALTANLSATGGSASVDSSAAFLPGDYTRCEFEINKVASVAAGVINFVNVAGVRTAFFGSSSIAHPNKTQIAVAKQNYPTLQVNLSPPRFTYPVVTATDILQRGGDGVRVRWADVNPDNLERYYVAWSKDADGGTNVNKLGSATPAWFQTDPLTPPSGVFIKQATKQQTLVIPQEDIGSVGTAIVVRVFARNGKQNYSGINGVGTLSNLLNSSVAAAGGTSPPTDPPSGAHVQYVVENVPEMTPEGMRARFRAVIDANGPGTKTFAQTGVTSIVCLFQTSTGKLRPEFFVDDPTLTRMEIQQYFTLGELITWQKNVAWNAGGSNGNASTSYQFRAGNGTPSLAGITAFSITSITAVPGDEKTSYLNWTYTLPATNPPLISHAIFLRQLAGEGAFTREGGKFPLPSEPNSQAAGAHAFTQIIKHPKKTGAQYKVRLVSVDGSILESAVFNYTSPDVDTGPPNNGTAITLTHAALKNGRMLIVRFTQPTSQMVSHTRNTLIIHDNNATGAGRRFYDPVSQTWVAAYTDGSTEIDLAKGGVPSYNMPASTVFVGGRTTIYIKIGVYNAFNGGSVTYSTDAPGVGVVGNIPSSGTGTEPADADTGAPTLASPSFPAVQDEDGVITVSPPPPVGNIKTLNQIQVVMSTQNTPPVAAPTQGSEGVVNIKHGDTVVFRPQRPQPVTLYFYYRARNAFNGSTYSVWSTGTQLDPSGISRPLKDFIGSGVPALPMALERAATSGTGHTLTTFTLDAGASGLPLFYFSSPPMILYVPSLNAGDSVRNIVGYNPVTKVVSLDVPFSGVPANSIPFEIHRGLIRGGKSGTGHTTGFFFLDAGASASDGVYAGMMIYIPSAPTAQKLHRVTAYVGSTRRCTLEAVETALASAPASNCGYMLSQGSFGYANFDGTGTIAPACYRVWRDNDTSQNVVEPILPTGENAYSMDLYHVLVKKKGDGSVHFDEDVRIGSTPVYRFAAPGGYVPMIQITFFLNAYRESGSDGKSAGTNYVIGFGPSTGVGAFLPGTFIPPFTDYRAQGNYPAKYSSY